MKPRRIVGHRGLWDAEAFHLTENDEPLPQSTPRHEEALQVKVRHPGLQIAPRDLLQGLPLLSRFRRQPQALASSILHPTLHPSHFVASTDLSGVLLATPDTSTTNPRFISRAPSSCAKKIQNGQVVSSLMSSNTRSAVGSRITPRRSAMLRCPAPGIQAASSMPQAGR